MKRFVALWCIAVLLVLSGCSLILPDIRGLHAELVSARVTAESGPAEMPTNPNPKPLPTAPTELPVENEPTQPPDYVTSLIQQMSLREKVGQLFIIQPDALVSPQEEGITEFTPEMADGLKKYPVGGFIIFSENIESPRQITAFNAALQKNSTLPLFICVDEEGGLVSRLSNHKAFNLPQYRSAANLGKSGNPDKALEMGRTIGGYLKEYGFNVDFAPVADVNTNPKNSVIGTRAFSSKPETAAQMAAAMAQGLREQDIIPTYKHFPGHGDTAEDSHDAPAVSHKTVPELAECEWIPFSYATEADMVMIGHIALPALLNDRTPATMSPEIVTGILKEQLGFQGLVVTDSLEMDAITALYTSDEAVLGALTAGCDLILMPANLEIAFEGLIKAVEDGRYSEAQLDTTVERILRFKEQHGMLGIG